MSLLLSLDLVRRDFTLSIHTAIDNRGVTAVYGPSGSGKTTLLRWIAGLETARNGQLSYNDQLWQDDKHCLPARQRQIGYVFQDARLFPHLTVQGNLDYAYRRRFNDHGPTPETVTAWLALAPLLASDISQLSGGEQQRVAIARALLSSPQLLLMDEPLASLDKAAKQEILGHLEALHQQLTIPILYVSHDLEEVSRLADQLLLLKQGRLIAQGALLELSTRLDLGLSHEENASAIIEATVHSQDHHYQLTELRIDGQLPLLLTTINRAIGESVRVRIPARDVSITLQRPECSSILNIIPATIEEIETTTSARTLVRLQLARQKLLVRLTQRSVEQLQLHTGQAVFAQIKTVALLSDRPSLAAQQP